MISENSANQNGNQAHKNAGKRIKLGLMLHLPNFLLTLQPYPLHSQDGSLPFQEKLSTGEH
jgi:hypothetical protein